MMTMMKVMMLMMMIWKDDADGALDPWSCLRYTFTGTLSKLRKCFPLYCLQGNLGKFPCTPYKGSMKIENSLVLCTIPYILIPLYYFLIPLYYISNK